MVVAPPLRATACRETCHGLSTKAFSSSSVSSGLTTQTTCISPWQGCACARRNRQARPAWSAPHGLKRLSFFDMAIGFLSILSFLSVMAVGAAARCERRRCAYSQRHAAARSSFPSTVRRGLVVLGSGRRRSGDEVEGAHQAIRAEHAGEHPGEVLTAALEGDVELLDQVLGPLRLTIRSTTQSSPTDSRTPLTAATSRARSACTLAARSSARR